MTIESGSNRRQDVDPATRAFADQSEAALRDVAPPDPEFRDDKTGEDIRAENARLAAELAAMKENSRLRTELEAAETARPRRRGKVAAVIAGAAVFLGGGGVVVASQLGGDRDPAAEAPATPGEAAPDDEAPVNPDNEAPADSPVENPGTAPTDLPTTGAEQPTEPEVDPLTISAGEIGASSVDVIQERFGGLDMKEMALMDDLSRWRHAAEFATQRGVYSPIVPMDYYGNTVITDGAEYLSTYVEVPPEEGSIIDAEIFQEFGYTRYTEGLEDALLGFGNIYHDIKDKIPNNDQALRRDFINGASSLFVRGGEGYVSGEIQCLDTNTCYDAEEASPLLGEYIEILDGLEDGVVVSDVQILYIDQTANYGTANLTVLVDTKGGSVDTERERLGLSIYDPLQTRVERGDVGTYSFEVSGNNAQPYYTDGSAVPQPFNRDYHDQARYLLRNDSL